MERKVLIMSSLSQNIETRRLFDRRASIDPIEGARALESMPHEDLDEADALASMSADHIGGLHGLYRLAVLDKTN